jgi:hypothetical protein
MAREYEIVLGLKLKKDYCDVKDFELELQQFNEANKGEIEVDIKRESEKVKRGVYLPIIKVKRSKK